jgi:Ca2+-binding RTX toxin-like protein
MVDRVSTGPNQTLEGTSGNDRLTADHENVILNGGAGDDIYTLNELNWTINDTGGTDVIFANFQFFSIELRPEIEELYGTLETSGQTLTGNAGNNRIGDGLGVNPDTMIGGDGNDIIGNNVGNDTLIGGVGNDYYIIETAGATVVENADEGSDTISTTLRSYTIAGLLNVENLYARTSSGHQLIGNSGNNKVYGRSGDDTLSGNEGADTLGGLGGDDTLIGGSGSDTYIVKQHSPQDLIRIVENQSEGIDQVICSLASFSIASMQNVENLRGVRDLFELRHIFTGNSGANEITGRSLDDELRGGRGNDILKGYNGNDYLSGGDDNDQITGGSGRDKLNGGAGRDDFIFVRTSDSTASSTGRDFITDFEKSLDDIDLRLIDGRTTTSGNNGFTFIGTRSFSDEAGELRYESVGSRTIVEGDVDGDGDADIQIELIGSFTLSSGDFIL